MTQSPERPVIRYFGGKWILAPWIISNFPPHRTYVEPYGGAASVLMRKPRSYAEIYNDIDSEVVNLFRILRDPVTCEELKRRLLLTPFSREEFIAAYHPRLEAMENARALIVRAYMGFGSDAHNTDRGMTGFRSNSNRSGTTPAYDWSNYPDQLTAFTERLKGVVIENRDALEVMSQQDSEETLHFVDPPYVHSTRGSNKGYRYEMDDSQHEALLDRLQDLKGMVVLCGYSSSNYDRLPWESVSRDSFADGARERTEVLWMNPAAMKSHAQLNLFKGSP